MLLQRSKSRLLADPDVSVSDLMVWLEGHMTAKGTRDIKGSVDIIERTCSWKSAPRLDMFLGSATLYKGLFEKVRNTIVPHVKLTAAVLACHQRAACIFGDRAPSVEAALISLIIRQGASKWRHVKSNEMARRILLTRASQTVFFALCVCEVKFQWNFMNSH